MADFDLRAKRVWVCGHRGMVGSALVRRLATEGVVLQTAERRDLDLREPAQVRSWMTENRPQVIFIAAAKVGGILANDTLPVDFLYDNIMIAANVISTAHQLDVGKLMYLGSSCIYPRLAPQPLKEGYLLSGPLEPTNEWYAVAKIAGLKLCAAYQRQYGRDFVAVMPTNLYGPGDNYDLASSHVLPALLRKVHEAKVASAPTVDIWGSGRPMREFLHVDDLANACVHVMRAYDGIEHINIGSGEEVTIEQLARTITQVIGYRGSLRFDSSKPDGTPRKLLDSSRVLGMGWRPRYALRDGIDQAYKAFLADVATLPGAAVA